MRNYSFHKSILTLVMAWCASFAYGQVAISVFAGRDTAICKAASLQLSSTGAYISGEVNDGTWFTNGDGRFFPSNMSTGVFSQTLTYIPGTVDINRGYTDLTLVSFDPDGTGPKVQVNDVMRLTLISDPPMICNNNLNVSLAANCQQEITASMVISNPQGNLADYRVELYYDGLKLPSNIITREYLNKQLEFKVFYTCGSNSCWGYITAQDKEAPRLACRDTVVACDVSILPDSIGFPLVNISSYVYKGNNKYEFALSDNCGKAFVYYTDEYMAMQCATTGYNSRIIRRWEAVDELGNKSYCTQNILVQAKPLSSVILPPNYDDITKPAFICGGNFKKLANGHPSPDDSGYPSARGCSNLEFSFTDTKFGICGNSYKLVRKWLLVDWCNSQTQDYAQIIKVIDKTPPVMVCPRDTNYKTTAYDCHSGLQALPVPKITDECGSALYQVNLKDSLNKVKDAFITFQQNKYFIRDLPVGKYSITYTAIDDCGNRDSCKIWIRVIDDQPPFTVCTEKIVANFNELTTSRMYPESVDQGSIDNCEIVKLELAKMTDSCGGKANVFGPYVDFCCAELGTTVMVALRATDKAGNSNTCMVEVKVQDKYAPEVVCPSDITIACTYPIDFKHLEEFGVVRSSQAQVKDIVIHDEINHGIVGKDGYATDNCTFTITEKYKSNLKCRTGTIERTFYATDASGNVDSCVQIITVVDPSPFDYEDIIWPRDTILDLCTVDEVDSLLTGKPTFYDSGCATPGIRFEDAVFDQFDGACYKIIRQWTVIDWCQYDGYNDKKGIWHYDQIIKLYNPEPPTIITACKDTTICMYSDTCGTELYERKLEATDNCTSAELLQWFWKIDLNNDGSVDLNGTGDVLKFMMPKGRHKITIEVRDQCGNKSSCSYKLYAKDCKAPTPYCVEQLGTVIMPTTGQITVWARDFDRGSYDNCTPSGKLKLSLSPDIRDTFITVTCADIPDGRSVLIPVKLYVTDEDGNQDYCLTNLLVQDNSDRCGDKNLGATLSGKLTSNLGRDLNDVTLHIKKMPDGTLNDFKVLASSFEIPDLLGNLTYMVQPDKLESEVKGINVVDILLIQKHVLVISKFQDPLQILSADVDNSGRIDVRDMVEIRKFVLGQSTQFSGGLPWWSFVAKDHVFADPKKPVRPDGKIYTDKLKEGENNILDIVGFRMGDVSLIGQTLTDNSTKNRSLPEAIQLELDEDGQLLLKQSVLTEGFQLELSGIRNLTDIRINESIAPYTYYHLSDQGKLSLMFYAESPMFLREGQSLFTLEQFEGGADLSSNFENIWISDAGAMPIALSHRSQNSGRETYQYEISVQQSVMELRDFGQAGSDIQIDIFDIQGRLVHHFKDVSAPVIRKYLPELKAGVYIANIRKDNFRRSLKFIAFD